MKQRLEYLELLGIGERSGVFGKDEELLNVTKKDVLKFGEAVRDVCIEARQKEIVELYEMTLAQAKTIKAYQDRNLNDEKIAEIWHQAGGHMYKFAKLLRDYLCQ